MRGAPIPIPKELSETVRRLREADYSGSWLLKKALPTLASFAARLKAPHARPTAKEQIEYLRALCLQAEIYDYYAEYKEAERVLEEDGRHLKVLLRRGDLGVESKQSAELSKPLLRQQLWTLVHCSHSLYRAEDLHEAENLLDRICAYVDRHLPLDSKSNPDEPSFGLRGRCAYSLGQVKRQLGDVAGARHEFMRAIEFTQKRVEAKTAKYKGTYLKQARVREQKYANYVIAKAFSFGLAWASFNSGELQRARCSAAAGCALLQFTRDDVHQAYAQVMYAQILAAGARPIEPGGDRPPELEEARSILLELAESPKSPLCKIPKFLARAQYALAQIFYATGEYDGAIEYAQQVCAAQKGQEKGRRWHLESVALLVRLLIKTGNLKEALARSDELIVMVKEKNVSKNHRADAFLCRAEVLMKSKRSLKEVNKALSKAEALWQKRPLALALCHLHRARFYAAQGNLGDARSHLHKWDLRERTIEHGYIKKLAAEVRIEIAQLAQQDSSLVAMMGEEKYQGAQAELRKRAIGYLYTLKGQDYLTNDYPMKVLGVSRQTVIGWQKKHNFDPRQMDKEYRSRPANDNDTRAMRGDAGGLLTKANKMR